jgi:hypothetical protein
MKKLGILIAVFGVFTLAGIASASTTADALQPASVQIINDELQVLGTARAYSARIGTQGLGGVTFFNGTIINETTNKDTKAEIPVTFGDDVRIDGRVWRGETAGPGLDDDREFVVNDDMEITGDLTVGGLLGTGIVNSTNILDATIAGADIANNAITSAKIASGTVATADIANNAITSAKIANGTITGSDISSSADLNVDSITATGDITQDLADHGAVKAMVYVPASGYCTSAANSRQWTYDDSVITCSKEGVGQYLVVFNFDIYDRFWQFTAIPTGDPAITQGYASPGPDNRRMYVGTFGSDGAPADGNFILTVY